MVQIPGSKIDKADVFQQAAGEGRLSMVKGLLPQNGDLKAIDKAFFGACVEGQTGTMKFLLEKGVDVNFVGDELGETPLMGAAQMGHTEAVKILLAHNANSNIKNKEGDTALSQALEYHHPEIAALLQQGGAKANIIDAASAGDVEAVRGFLKTDPKALNDKDRIGFSALYHAAEAGHAEVAKVLLAAGADPNDFTGNGGWGESPLFIAADKGHTDVIEILVAHGADVNSKSLGKDTALCLAAENGHLKTAEVLLSHGAQVNVNGGPLEMTPLDEAAHIGNKALVELLISHKADPNMRASDGSTPLHTAAYYGHSEIVEILLAAGADINAKDREGKTALGEAKSRGQGAAAKVLRQHGAQE